MKNIVIKQSASELMKDNTYSKVVESVKKSKAKEGIIGSINFIIKRGVLYLF